MVNAKTVKIILREILVVSVILAVVELFYAIGYRNLDLPFGRANNSIVPKYSTAAKDSSMVLFENGLIFLFKKPPAHEEIVNAYTGKEESLVAEILYPNNTYNEFFIFHLNPTFGFIGIEFDKMGRWLLLLAYPLYWIIRAVFWVENALKEMNA